jgi:hypothetical protein
MKLPTQLLGIIESFNRLRGAMGGLSAVLEAKGMVRSIPFKDVAEGAKNTASAIMNAFQHLPTTIANIFRGGMSIIQSGWAVLSTSLLGSVAVTVASVGAIAWEVFEIWKNVTGRSKQEIEAAQKDFDSIANEAATDAVLEELEKLKTGFEDTEAALARFDGKQKEFLEGKIASKKAPLLDALQKYNESLGEGEEHLKVFEAQLEVLGKNGMLAAALEGDKEALDAIGPNMQKYIEFLRLMSLANFEAAFNADENKKAMLKQVEALKEAKNKSDELTQATYDNGLKKLYNKTIDELPNQLKRMKAIADKQGIEFKPKVVIDQFFKERLGEDTKKLLDGIPGLSEDVVKQGLSRMLMAYKGSGQALIHAAAESLDAMADRIKEFGGGIKDAMEHLYIDPKKMLGMVTPLLDNIKKLNPITKEVTDRSRSGESYSQK